jgi:hypothetical protein
MNSGFNYFKPYQRKPTATARLSFHLSISYLYKQTFIDPLEHSIERG